ncbi:MAG: transcription termination/antitermination factor NusG [Clostridiales bacterium]|nr:transcription termination/antitermination factor NusG [Clostridiales bacterium]
MTEEFNEEVIADVADVASDDLPDSSKGKWYVLHTYSGHENKVKASIEMMVENRGLQDYIFEVYIPMDETVEVDGAKRRVVKRKTFPGYVLIKMIVTEESWHVVRNIRGVTGFVGEGMDPIELTNEEIVKLGVEDVQVKLDVELGENVRVLSGPLENFTGVVSEIYPDKQRVKVIVYMFGREMPVDLKYNQIQKLL